MVRKARLAASDNCARHHAVRGKHLLSFAAHLAVEAEIGNHVLPAGVRAAREIDLEIHELVEIETGVSELSCDGLECTLGETDA